VAPLKVVQQRLELGRALSCRLHKELVVETVKQVEWSSSPKKPIKPMLSVRHDC
jgi:hypothetical protein